MTAHNTKTSLIAVIRIEAAIDAEGDYIELMSALLHNQVTWIDFFNKSFKIKQ